MSGDELLMANSPTGTLLIGNALIWDVPRGWSILLPISDRAESLEVLRSKDCQGWSPAQKRHLCAWSTRVVHFVAPISDRAGLFDVF